MRVSRHRSDRGREGNRQLEAYCQDTFLSLNFLEKHHGLKLIGRENRARLRARLPSPRWQQMLSCIDETRRARGGGGGGGEAGGWKGHSAKTAGIEDMRSKHEREANGSGSGETSPASCTRTIRNTRKVYGQLPGSSERARGNSRSGTGTEAFSALEQVHALLKEVRLNLSCRRED